MNHAAKLAALALFLLWLNAPAPESTPAQQAPPGPPTRAAEPRAASVAKSPAAQASAPPKKSAYAEDRVLVRLEPGASAQVVAAAHGSEVLRAAGPAGWATLRVPEGSSPGALAAALRADDRVRGATLSGRVYGASDTSCASTSSGVSRANEYQWFLDADAAPAAGRKDLSGVVVAVIDTGVAWDTSADRGVAVAPSLSKVDFVAPYDFVHDDAWPDDDHMHGTHIASVIASEGDIEGVAAGVTIMPIKVLDADNTGDEAALVDGIVWAVDHGADVINLSLSFADGYVPSRALHDALTDAYDAGVVVVAAAGNDAASQVTWPAAARTVVAVGAWSLTEGGLPGVTDYTSRSPQVDLLAPGGDLDEDWTCDGYGDGILAETINEGDPTSFGYWFYEGTSQAAAQVSAAAAWLVRAGLSGEQIPAMLQTSAWDIGDTSYEAGTGAGILDITESAMKLRAGELPVERGVHVALLAWPARVSSGVQVAARVTVVDDHGVLVPGALVVARAQSAAGDTERLSCTTASDGTCDLTGTTHADEAGEPASMAWLVSIDGVGHPGDDATVMRRPGPLLFATDALEVLTATLGEDDILALRWESVTDGSLGELTDGLTVMSMASGVVSTPSALVLTEGMVREIFDSVAVELDLDGAGLHTDPLGVADAEILSLVAGAGLHTDPLGLTGAGTSVVAVSGTGLHTDPLGFHARELTTPAVGEDLGLGLTGAMVFLDAGTATVDLSGTAVGARIEDGGWTTAGDYAADTALGASGLVGAFTDSTTSAAGERILVTHF